MRSGEQLLLYLDSELQARDTIGDNAVNTLTFTITLNDPQTSATIDEVQLFDSALSATELAEASSTADSLSADEAGLSLAFDASDESDTVSASKYYYLNGLRVAKAVDGEVTWIHSDHLHSATILTDASGAELRRLAYRAFGEEAENTGTGEAPTYSYTGKERDATGLLYYGARYYDPALSRFITADTVYDHGPQGLNRYSYALNNPIRYNDPSGHMSNPFAVMFRGLQDSPVGQLIGNLMRDEAEATAAAVEHQVTPPEQDAGMVEGSVPVWGDAKDSYLALKEGKVVYGMLFAGMAISDVFDGGMSPEDLAKAGIRGGKEVAEKLAKEGGEQFAKEGPEQALMTTTGQIIKGRGRPSDEELALAEELFTSKGYDVLVRGHGVPKPDFGVLTVEGLTNIEVKTISSKRKIGRRIKEGFEKFDTGGGVLLDVRPAGISNVDAISRVNRAFSDGLVPEGGSVRLINETLDITFSN